jgi:fatty acid desaturase
VENFSLTQARSLIGDLLRPNPRVYWADFLLSLLGGHLLAAVVQMLVYAEPSWQTALIQAICFVGAGLLFYRAVSFIHELAHLPQQEFRTFRLAWNLLCGIPFLIPSFVYYTHLDHHRRKLFATSADGEYMPLARRGWWHIAYYLALIPILPVFAVVRFALLTPLAWMHPAMRRWVHRHASSMVMDPAYVRPLPSAALMRTIVWQEIGCFLVTTGAITVLLVFGKWPFPILVQFYCSAIFVITINSFRTLAAHRWWNDGRELSFTEQLLDSVSIDGQPWLSELWGPVGLRFHSLHHLFPSLPYHNLAAAHRRLMAGLPADSPYRQTVEPSLTAALGQLLRRSWAAGRLDQLPPPSASPAE